MSQVDVPALAARGTATGPGGETTVSILASGVDTVSVRRLWADWQVSPAESDGASFSKEPPEGWCKFQWDTVQDTVEPDLQISVPSYYIGGRYELAVVGTDQSTRATTTTMVAVDGSTHDVETTPVIQGLEHPWGFSFLGDGSRLLVTERDAGRLLLADLTDNTTEVVDGTPEVYSGGQGGLLDVTLHPAFSEEPWVYLTYSAASGEREATHLGRGRFDPAGPSLTEFEQLHVAEPFVRSGKHFGSRVIFGDDGKLYMTTGDRRDMSFDNPMDHVSQDRSNELGSTLRLDPDGSIPDDNPFVDDPEGADAVFSYGHRNPQGITVHPETGAVWLSEHGERDGDEINVVQAGDNHGWPVASYACEYGTETPIGDRPHERTDVADPIYFWECGTGGFPPSNATFYSGSTFPDWQGNLLVGNLAGQYLGRLIVQGDQVVETTPLLADRGWRIRDVQEHPPTGHIYVAVDADNAAIVQLSPE